jgi:hydroxyethylthiazole kinase-like uncharacterized protein yjeF
VVTALEQKRVEQIAIDAGVDPESFTKRAGFCIAKAVDVFCKEHHLPRKVHGLIGKGNNGKDGLEALKCLERLGYQIRFDLDQLDEGIILDALYGIGFEGQILKDQAFYVEKANASKLPIVSVDIPSGVCATTGAVSNCHIKASHTIAIGTYKIGHLLEPGYTTYDTIELVDFGLDQKYFDQLQEVYRVVDLSQIHEPDLAKKMHKYQRGYVGVFAGSEGMEGAAYFTAKAAFHAGAGMVRLFVDEHFNFPLLEAVYSAQDIADLKRFGKKLDVLVIGPGLDQTKKNEILAVLQYAADEKIPLVVDAGAIEWFASMDNPPFAIVTPNGSEIHKMQRHVRGNFILYEKGPPTWIFDPSATIPYVIIEAEPRLATAGTGDILSGLIAAYFCRTKDLTLASILASNRLLKACKKSQKEFPISSELLDLL